MLDVFLTAIGLMLIFEGVMPFLNPQSWRKMFSLVLQMNDADLRRMGLITMISGLILIFIVSQ